MNTYAMIQDEKQVEALKSLKRLDDKGQLYEMEVNYDYYPLLPMLNSMIDAGCSTFFTKNVENEYLFCRNYDYSHFLHNDRHNPRTALNVIIKNNNPNNKYRSIGVADGFWLDYKNGTFVEGCIDDGKTDLSPFVLLPFLCMDGLNEKGLCVSVMALSVKGTWTEIPYEGALEKQPYGKDPYILKEPGELPKEDYVFVADDIIAINEADKKAWICKAEMWKTTMPNKKGTLLPPLLMRFMLDNCQNVEEAIALASEYNIMAQGPGSGYHILVADKSGNSKLIEWVDNKMNIVDTNHATNYTRSVDDAFHGVCKRDECIKAGLFRTELGGMREDYAKALLQLVSQDFATHNDRNVTLYSCIYNATKGSLELFNFRDYTKSYKVSL